LAAQKRLKPEPSSTQLNNSPLFSSEWDREIEADVKVGRLDAAGKRADRFRSWTLHPTLKHFASPEFWFHYRQLPEKVRDLADKNFALLKPTLVTPRSDLKR